MDREGGNKEKMRKSWEWISFHFLILSLFPHSLSISSSFSHSLSIFSQPGCQDATICATLISFNIIQCSIITVNCGDQEILPKYELHTIKHTSLTSLSFKSCRLLYLCWKAVSLYVRWLSLSGFSLAPFTPSKQPPFGRAPPPPPPPCTPPPPSLALVLLVPLLHLLLLLLFFWQWHLCFSSWLPC